MWVNQTDVKTCWEMLSEYLWNILGPLSSKDSLSCLVTFMVDIVKNGFIMPRLWVKFLSILANYDESIPLTILHIIVAGNIVLKWLFLMLSICVTKQDKRGVCHSIVVFLWVFNVKLFFLLHFLKIYILIG